MSVVELGASRMMFSRDQALARAINGLFDALRRQLVAVGLVEHPVAIL